MPCGCKKGHGMRLYGAGVKRKKGGMAISGAGYRKRKRRRRRKGGSVSASLLGGLGVRAFLPRLARLKRGGKILSGAVWHGYGSGMSLHGAGVRGKRVLPRRGKGKRLI